MNVGDARPDDGPVRLGPADRWIRSRAREMIEAVTRAMDTYRFDLYANAVYEFAWHEYCDWYLELTKPVLWDESTDPASARGVRRTLLEVLDAVLRAAHPIMPYITDSLWREQAAVSGNGAPGATEAGTIMLAPFPEAEDFDDDPEATAAIEWLKAVVVGVRTIRSEMNVPPRTSIALLLQGGDPVDRARLDATRTLLCRLAGIGHGRVARGGCRGAARRRSHVVGDLKVLVPLEGRDRRRPRASAPVEGDRQVLPGGRARAGEAGATRTSSPRRRRHIVAAERDKAADLSTRLDALRAQFERLDGL